MTFTERFWAHLTRKDMFYPALAILAFIAILWVTGHIDALSGFAYGILILLWALLGPSLFYAAAKIDPGVESLSESFLIHANWSLALAYILWPPFLLVCLAMFHGYFVNYFAIILAVWIGWPLFLRIKLRQEVRSRSETR